LREDWPLDPGIAYLNHGGFGVTPNAVLAEQRRWRERIDANPNRFVREELTAALDEAIAGVAQAVGAIPADLVPVDNATTGCNAVLRSLAFRPGDQILLTSLAYPGIRNAARYVASVTGATLVEVPVPLPLADEKTLLDAVAARLGPRTRLAVFDHVASHSALLLPIAALTWLAHEAGAQVLIDGAHAPGMLALDVSAFGADWYVGTLHKWFFAPRAAAFLWAKPGTAQAIVPPVVSVNHGGGFQAEFAWTGTRDPSAFLAAPAGIACHARLGGPVLMERNSALIREAAALLADAWGTVASGPIGDCAMAALRLPLALPATAAGAAAVGRFLSHVHRVEVAVHPIDGALWLRVAAQAYNARAQYERLAAALRPGMELPV
jgi:isopenicillin-N epimerase